MNNAQYAKEILKVLGENGEHWVKGAYAVDKNNTSVFIDDEAAYRFCLSGALNKVATSVDDNFAFRDMFMVKINSTIINWNDCPTTTWEDVKRLLTEIAEEK